MEKKQSFYISELSGIEHSFSDYHFCRGNSNKRKTRLGLIVKGSGIYIYLNKKLEVREGDVVFIPENVFCYSEWYGEPEIKVKYISFFMNYQTSCFEYEPQNLECGKEIWNDLLEIHALLSDEFIDELEAYSRFYLLLKKIIPDMTQSKLAMDKSLQDAIAYIIENWDKDYLFQDVAKRCCVSESKLYHLFQKQLGQSPVSFLNSIRINHAINYLENTNYSISYIGQLVGFNSENHFRKIFKNITGTTPLKFRKSS